MAEEKKEQEHSHHEHHEHHEKEHEEHHLKHHKKTYNIWMIAAIIVAALLITSLVFNFKSSGPGIGKDAAGKKITDFFKTYQGLDTTIVSVTEEAGLYAVTIESGTNQGTFYLTKDGKMMGTMTALKDIEAQNTQQQTTEIPKTAKPTVELYVMAFCPYGVQAENAMKSVYDLLKNNVDFKIRFIAQISGSTVDSVQSLHGTNEAKEDLRQVCIQKTYPSLYWNYVSQINTNCYSKYSDATELDKCWKDVATKLDISVTQIETCAYGTEGLNLLKADETLTTKYSISGSPTIMINGVTYSGGRTEEAYKTAICNAFTTAPAECSETLSSAQTTSSGSC